MSPVQFRRALDDGMGRSIPPHEPSAVIIVYAKESAWREDASALTMVHKSAA